MQTEEYLTALFRELERLKKSAGWVTLGHGVIWDKRRESLTLLVNVGDCVYPHPLHPGDLGDDPVAAAANLMAAALPEILTHDVSLITFKT